ncbi:hypothetical protein HC752_12160 [Vibrio sp. S9_S30]|nr:hypothetical protein [Vibrio sp. S9_S30]MBD1557687.1 hypothetical protein [Vibrio sp. S9_S30]
MFHNSVLLMSISSVVPSPNSVAIGTGLVPFSQVLFLGYINHQDEV